MEIQMNELSVSPKEQLLQAGFDILASHSVFATLVSRLRELEMVAVAFSGGVDSAFLAFVARAVLGRDSVQAITAVSPSLGSGELEHCRHLAELWDIPFLSVLTREMENPNYLANREDRCYWCKAELMSSIAPIIESTNFQVVLGVNVDDLGDHRPGQQAAKEASALFPLVDAGYTKKLIREHSRELGLSTWDRPQSACLASRIPYGTSVSLPILAQLDRAEAALKRLGFAQVRVRHYGSLARIEFTIEDLEKALEKRLEIVAAVRGAGYDYVTVDLEGFRSGNLNSKIVPQVS